MVVVAQQREDDGESEEFGEGDGEPKAGGPEKMREEDEAGHD